MGRMGQITQQNMNDLHDLMMALPPVGAQTYLQVIQNEAMRLDALRLPHYCGHCDLRYETAWFEGRRPGQEGHCFFCHRFRTPRITRFALLRETEWFFIQSGNTMTEKRAFYEAYFFYLHRWADRFSLPSTQEEVAYQEELGQSLSEAKE